MAELSRAAHNPTRVYLWFALPIVVATTSFGSGVLLARALAPPHICSCEDSVAQSADAPAVRAAPRADFGTLRARRLAPRAPAKTWSPSLREQTVTSVIPRSALDTLTSQPERLPSPRAIPYIEDGETRGFKVYAIPKKSFLTDIGFRNGDVVTQINDHPLTSLEEGLEAYRSAKDAWTVTIDIDRDGTRIQLKVVAEPDGAVVRRPRAL